MEKNKVCEGMKGISEEEDKRQSEGKKGSEKTKQGTELEREREIEREWERNKEKKVAGVGMCEEKETDGIYICLLMGVC